MTAHAISDDSATCETCGIGLARRYIGGRLLCEYCSEWVVLTNTEHHQAIDRLWLESIRQARLHKRDEEIGRFFVGISNVGGFLLLVLGAVAFGYWLLVKP